MAGEPAAQPAEERVVEKGLQSETQQERANEATVTQQNGVEEERAPELPPRPLPAAYPNGKRVSIQQPVQFIAPPFQQPCDPYEPERNCERPSNPKWDKVKFGLYLLSLVVSGVIFGLGITIGIHTAPYMTAYYSYPSEIELGTSGAAAGLAIIFVCLDLLRICLSTARRGLHPGLLVTFNLFIWLVAVVAIVITTIFATDNTDSYDYYEYPDGLEGTTLAAKTKRYEKALLGFDCCLLALHFILFVGACAETSQHNKAKRKTVYVAVMPNGEQIPAQPGQAVVYQPVNQGYTVVQMPPTNGVQWTAPGRSVTSTSQWVPAPAPHVNQYGGYYAPVQPTMTYAVPQQQGYYVPQQPSSSVLAVPKPALKSRRAAPAVAEASSSSSSSAPTPPPKESPAQNTTEPVAGK